MKLRLQFNIKSKSAPVLISGGLMIAMIFMTGLLSLTGVFSASHSLGDITYNNLDNLTTDDLVELYVNNPWLEDVFIFFSEFLEPTTGESNNNPWDYSDSNNL